MAFLTLDSILLLKFNSESGALPGLDLGSTPWLLYHFLPLSPPLSVFEPHVSVFSSPYLQMPPPTMPSLPPQLHSYIMMALLSKLQASPPPERAPASLPRLLLDIPLWLSYTSSVPKCLPPRSLSFPHPPPPHPLASQMSSAAFTPPYSKPQTSP